MSLFGNLFNKGPKPIIAHSQPVSLASLKASNNRPQSGAMYQTKQDVYYVTASVEPCSLSVP